MRNETRWGSALALGALVRGVLGAVVAVGEFDTELVADDAHPARPGTSANNAVRARNPGRASGVREI
ncbi:MAG: hypothetical protein ACKOW5_04190, partial [Actinomycetales bacterium]